MKLPKIDSEDVLVFGSLGLAALGIALITASVTGQGVLAFGVALMVFGIPSALIAFMAAGESK